VAVTLEIAFAEPDTFRHFLDRVNLRGAEECAAQQAAEDGGRYQPFAVHN
jgi:hypothetical protein